MSIAVGIERLAEEVARYGAPYLLTTGPDGRPHAVSVPCRFEDDRFAVSAGRSSLANAGERPYVTLLFPPVEAGGYSLIVDGRAAPSAAGLAVKPTHAVLHRPAVAPPEDADACGHDCQPVL